MRARLDESSELARRLAHELAYVRSAGASSPDAELVLAAYARWGTRFAEHLRGDFAAVIWDPREDLLIAAVDPFAVGALFVTRLPTGERAFATHITPLRTLHAFDLDLEVVARYLESLPTEPHRTSFRGIHRVGPGATVVQGEETTRTSIYWSLDDVPVRTSSPRDALDSFDEALVRAVARRVTADVPLALALSAGLDSSSILGVASELGASENLVALSVTPPQESCREEEGVQALGQRLGVAPHFLTPTTSLEALCDVCRISGEPRYLDYFPLVVSLVQHLGARGPFRLLTGQHGDAVSGYTRNGFYPSLFRASPGDWVRQLGHRTAPERARLALASVLRSIPLTDALLRARPSPIERPLSALDERVSRSLGIEQARAELSLALHRERSDVNFARRNAFTSNLIPETEFTGRAAAWSGGESAYPFLDRDLVTASFALPVEALRGPDGSNRFPLRATMKNRLPEFVLAPRKKVVFNEFYKALFDELEVELARLPWADELRPLVSAPRYATLRAEKPVFFSTRQHLFRCLAVNFWLIHHSRTEFTAP